ncbi:MAG: archease [Chlorobiaceae bacterium]|nr:archease [Chlorobiaceae bacterium]
MPFRLIEHTADLCFEVTAGSFGELLEESMRAMTGWTGPVWGTAVVECRFSVESPGRAVLLVDLLNEALTLSQIHREAYERIEFRCLEERRAEGRFIGRSITGARDEIKAVTYHGAKVERQPDGTWLATILMDI